MTENTSFISNRNIKDKDNISNNDIIDLIIKFQPENLMEIFTNAE